MCSSSKNELIRFNAYFVNAYLGVAIIDTKVTLKLIQN